MYDLISQELDAFIGRGFKQADLARKLDKGTDQVCRWLSGPGNMTIDTVSDLLLGLSGSELVMELHEINRQPPREIKGPAWLMHALSEHKTHQTKAISNGLEPLAVVLLEPLSVKVETISATFETAKTYEVVGV